MTLTITINHDGVVRTTNLREEDVLALKNDLLDVPDWVEGALKGKIHSTKTRMVRDWQKRLMADPDVETIPADADAMIQTVVARPDYMNRTAREAEAKRQAALEAARNEATLDATPPAP